MQINALFIHRDLDARTRFRDLAEQFNVFGRLKLATTFGEGLDRLRGESEVGAFYIGGPLDQNQIGNVVASMRSTRQGKQCAFMLHLAGQASDMSLRSAMAEGVDGFLANAFTADDIRTSAKIAAVVSRRRGEIVFKAALAEWKMRSTDVLSTASAFIKSGVPHALMFEELHTQVRALREANQFDESKYFEEIIAAFTSISAPKKVERSLPTPQASSVPRVIRRSA